MDINTEPLIASLEAQAKRILDIEIPERGDDAKKAAWAKRRAEGKKLTMLASNLTVDEAKAIYEQLYDVYSFGSQADEKRALELVKHEAQDRVRLALRDKSALADIEQAIAKFRGVVTKKIKHSGNEYTYRALKVSDDLFIAIEREDDGFPTKLRGLDAQGDWVLGSAQIYAADRRYLDREIEPAYVSCSSAGKLTPEQARAQAQMTVIASELAELYTARDLPWLQYEVTVAEAARERHQTKAREQAAKIRDLGDRVQAATVGADVRVTVQGKKTPYTGGLTRVDNGARFHIHVAYREEPIDVLVDRIAKLEVKTNGRYTEVEL